jgi:hypothetical protein
LFPGPGLVSGLGPAFLSGFGPGFLSGFGPAFLSGFGPGPLCLLSGPFRGWCISCLGGRTFLTRGAGGGTGTGATLGAGGSGTGGSGTLGGLGNLGGPGRAGGPGMTGGRGTAHVSWLLYEKTTVAATETTNTDSVRMKFSFTFWCVTTLTRQREPA